MSVGFLADGRAVITGLMTDPAASEPFQKARLWAERLVLYITPGRYRFHELRQSLAEDSTLYAALLVAGVARQRGSACETAKHLVEAALCLKLGRTLLDDTATTAALHRGPQLSQALVTAHGLLPAELGAAIAEYQERIDGRGTPLGITAVSLPGRILGLCALYAHHAQPVGLGALPAYTILENMHRAEGSGLDPQLIAELLTLLARRDDSWRMT